MKHEKIVKGMLLGLVLLGIVSIARRAFGIDPAYFGVAYLVLAFVTMLIKDKKKQENKK